MLKKIYQKDGIIVILNDKSMTNKDMELCYLITNSYDPKKQFEQYKKEYYETKGFIYPQLD
tara:strand:- start:7030 stop:7212 length:183 start_codon:yes stop_codon:yes gene_type:complete